MTIITENTDAATLNGLVEDHRRQCVASGDFKVSGLHARLAEAYAVLAGIAEANERQIAQEWAILNNELAKTR